MFARLQAGRGRAETLFPLSPIFLFVVIVMRWERVSLFPFPPILRLLENFRLFI